MQKYLKGHWHIIFLTTFFFFVYSFISIVKHNHYQTFTWDTGFFDQLIWKLSRLENPISSFSGLHVFGDHFQLILLLTVPLYWFPKSLYLLFTFHAAVAVLSVIPIYLMSLKISKNKLLALSISFAFLIFVPMQFAILDGFHQSVFAPFFYTWAIYGLVNKVEKIYWVSILGLLITKEEMALLVVAIGAVAFLSGKKFQGITTIVIGIISFLLIVQIFLPWVQGSYVHSEFGQLGNSPVEVIENVISNPAQVGLLIFEPSIKLKTLFNTFYSFGFLPILSPAFLIPGLQQFFVRFLDTVTIHRWTNLNHYSFPLAPIMAIATIFAAKKLIQNFKVNTNIIALYVLLFALFQNYSMHGPINSLIKRDFYDKKQWMKNNDQILKMIPKNASVAATNNLGPHLSQRSELYFLSDHHSAEYLAFDLENGPNKYSPLTYEQTEQIYVDELSSGKYELWTDIGEAKVLRRK